MIRACKESRQITAQNVEIETIFFCKFYFHFIRFYAVFSLPGCCTRYFGRNLIHSADACFIVMACTGYSHAQLKPLSSLLKCLSIQFYCVNSNPKFQFFITNKLSLTSEKKICQLSNKKGKAILPCVDRTFLPFNVNRIQNKSADMLLSSK